MSFSLDKDRFMSRIVKKETIMNRETGVRILSITVSIAILLSTLPSCDAGITPAISYSQSSSTGLSNEESSNPDSEPASSESRQSASDSQAASSASPVSNASSTAGSTSASATSGSGSLQADIDFYKEILEIETGWLSGLQLPNGAMPMTAAKTGTVKVNPYFSSFAVLAILEGDKKYYPVVKKYMDWHFAHLNTAATDYNGVDGTIYDYDITVSDGKVVSEAIATNDRGTKQYDSSDSYAAMFLAILWSYYDKTGDAAYIKAHYTEIKRILNALYNTMNDGLTWAKPDYKIKYLMDNAEVWRGIDKAVLLYEKVLKPAFADASAMLTRLKADRTLVASKIEELMWNEAGQYYECAIGEGGEVAYNFDWNNFYPSATSQVFVITNGLLKTDSARAKLVYANFNKYYSTGESKKTWEQMSIPDAFYWGELVYAGALMKDEARVKSYMTLYRRVMKNHAYPLYNADAGKATLAAAYMVEYLSSK